MISLFVQWGIYALKPIQLTLDSDNHAAASKVDVDGYINTITIIDLVIIFILIALTGGITSNSFVSVRRKKEVKPFEKKRRCESTPQA